MRRLLGLAAAVALLTAACGGSSSSSSKVAASSPGSSSTPSTSSAPPSTTTTAAAKPASSTAANTAPARPTRCRADELTLSFLGGQGATGHGELGLALRNSGSRTCIAFGYPGVEFLDRGGRALPTIPTHTTQDFFGSVTDHPLSLSPGGEVSFRLGVTHGMTSTTGCTTAYGLQVIPPNDTATLRVTIPNGAYECQTVTVVPLQSGTSAYA